jgi:hypothetical protein
VKVVDGPMGCIDPLQPLTAARRFEIMTDYYHIYVSDCLDTLQVPMVYQIESLDNWVRQRLGTTTKIWQDDDSRPEWDRRPKLQSLIEQCNRDCHIMVTRIERLDALLLRLSKCVRAIGKREATLHVLNFGGSPLDIDATASKSFERIFKGCYEVQQAHLFQKKRPTWSETPMAVAYDEREQTRLRYVFYQVRVLGRSVAELLQEAYTQKWNQGNRVRWVRKAELDKGRSPRSSMLYRAMVRWETTHAEEAARLAAMPEDLVQWG